jgi:hypothetical protein
MIVSKVCDGITTQIYPTVNADKAAVEKPAVLIENLVKAV